MVNEIKGLTCPPNSGYTFVQQKDRQNGRQPQVGSLPMKEEAECGLMEFPPDLGRGS